MFGGRAAAKVLLDVPEAQGTNRLLAFPSLMIAVHAGCKGYGAYVFAAIESLVCQSHSGRSASWLGKALIRWCVYVCFCVLPCGCSPVNIVNDEADNAVVSHLC